MYLLTSILLGNGQKHTALLLKLLQNIKIMNIVHGNSDSNFDQSESLSGRKNVWYRNIFSRKCVRLRYIPVGILHGRFFYKHSNIARRFPKKKKTQKNNNNAAMLPKLQHKIINTRYFAQQLGFRISTNQNSEFLN